MLRSHHSMLAIVRRALCLATRSRHATVRGDVIVRRHMSVVTRLSDDVLDVRPEVRDWLERGEPVVALESTIITHGMRHPQNIKVALAVEAEVREQGALAATVAILNGKIRVGLSAEEIGFLGSESAKAVKTSRRDLPYVLANGANGGTTVSATMMAAHAAGIAVFATGGIGGVHRRLSQYDEMDISADLTELGRTPVAVVCAGIKSILHVPNTLQYLETQGVCVLSYGPSFRFPGFWSVDSGSLAPYRVQTPLEAATLIDKVQSLHLMGGGAGRGGGGGSGAGCVIAVPIPDQHALDGDRLEKVIQEALHAARQSKISGKDLTPFLLKSVNELTEGRSQEANEALVRNNAKVGAQIAVQLSELKRASTSLTARRGVTTPTATAQAARSPRLSESRPTQLSTAAPVQAAPKNGGDVTATPVTNRPVVIGGSNVDFLVQILQDEVAHVASKEKHRSKARL